MKKLRNVIAIVILFALLTFNCFAESFGAGEYTPSGASIESGGNVILDSLSGDTVRLEKNIASEIKSVLGENGGTVNISVSVNPTYKESESGNISVLIALNSKGSSSGGFVLSAEEAKSSTQTLTVTIKGIDKEKLESLHIGNTSVTGTPATSTPTPEESTTPTASSDTTPTPTHTATPETDKKTATPDTTVKPTNSSSGYVYERTNDPYSDKDRVTNAPPSIVEDVDISGLDIANPVQDAETPEPALEQFKEKVSNDPATGLIVLFVVLLLLLGADIGAIIWRKKLGFSGLINGGIAHRKVRDDLFDDPKDGVVEEKKEDRFDQDLDR